MALRRDEELSRTARDELAAFIWLTERVRFPRPRPTVYPIEMYEKVAKLISGGTHNEGDCGGEIEVKIFRRQRRVEVLCKKCKQLSVIQNGVVVKDGAQASVV